MSYWVIPGAPLEGGKGWRVWYSRTGTQSFSPQTPSVKRAQQDVGFKLSWKVFDPINGLNRRMGILTIELDAPIPGSHYEIYIPESSVQPFRWATLPAEITRDGVAFLFGSCFWRDNDINGAFSVAVRTLSKQWLPAFKFLTGDQVYQDWPSAPFNKKSALALYAERYEDYWGDPGYQEVLSECPNFFMCDDHEFWNDFPERQAHLSRTWTAESRREYGEAAQSLYRYYQSSLNPGDKPWYSFTVGSVSFFVVDTRSQRDSIMTDPPKGRVPQFMQESQWNDFEAWIRDLRGPGVVVLGQPLFQKDGNWKDHSLSNFPQDYGRFCALIAASHRGENAECKPHQILMLSGDIHTGRYSSGVIAGIADQGLRLTHEFIASAASTVGPYPKKSSIEEPPTKIVANWNNRKTQLDVSMERSCILGDGAHTTPTGDNNLGMVRMFPGTNGRVRFELSTWRVRPHDDRSWWDRLKDDKQPQGAVIPLFRREIELV